MTEEMWQQSTNPLQVAIAQRSWPTRFNHSLTRKCGLVTCGYVLHSPAAFRSPLAVEIAQTVQQHLAESPPSDQLQQDTRAKLLAKFPKALVDTRYSISINQLHARLTSPDETRLPTFLSAVAFYLGRYGMSQIAMQYLDLVRAEAHAKTQRELHALRESYRATEARKPKVLPLTSISIWRRALDRWFGMLPQGVNPAESEHELPGFREAVLALLPEAERPLHEAYTWDGHNVPLSVQQRLGEIASETLRTEASKQMTDIVRDILGNPFRPKAVLSEWREANFGAVVRIAEHIVSTSNYSDVTILADSLEDAGCSDEELLSFCRKSKHFPGCWIVDAVLGRH